jgi:uncharacterized protein YgbK (DUF1537 family)
MTFAEGLLLTYYGDDFTGSTDVMESLAIAGVRTVLFLEPPTPEMLCRFEGVQAVGVAGNSRTMTPQTMDEVLPSIFGRLKELGSPLFHYKICSTFDSSPQIGSIGRAVDLGQRLFASPFVPLLVGAPRLGRYTVFGNLFARSGLESEPYRLDQHPTMRHHPVTPMRESDLRAHLSQQTDRQISLFDVLRLEGSAEEGFRKLLAEKPEIILFDVLYDHQLGDIGRLVWERADQEAPLFAVGSSGLEYALTAYWSAAGRLPEQPPEFEPFSPVERLVVVSGSCSPVTERQISYSLEHGFVEVSLDPARLANPQEVDGEVERAVEATLDQLSAGSSVILHICRGPNDPRVRIAGLQFEAMGYGGLEAKLVSGKILGGALGRILQRILERAEVRRAVVAGGDTSGYVAEQLDIEALEVIAPTAPGAPLCRTYSPRGDLNDLEILFKGGQVGWQDFFVNALRGMSNEDDRLGGKRMPTKIAVFGAAGNMGTRTSRSLKQSGKYELLFIEAGEAGQQKLRDRGDTPTPEDEALDRADVVLLAVPDHLIGPVAEQVVPKAKSGALIMCLDPAAPYGGKLPERNDVSYFITHPGHPPVFNDEQTMEARRDFFGSGIAKQSIVNALVQGSDEDYAKGEAIASKMWRPVLRSHQVTVEQMAILEPVLSETVACTCCVLMREAMDEAISCGVPAEAARDFLLGHINIALAIAFEEIEWDFSAGAKMAIEEAKKDIFQPDWKKVFKPESLRRSVAKITGDVPGG